MLKKTLLSILIVLLSSFGLVFSAYADTGSIKVTEPIRQEVTAVFDFDRAWPIVKSERVEWVDEETGQLVTRVTIIRESPPMWKYASPEECQEVGLFACVWSSARVTEEHVTIGNVTSHAKHFMDKYCNGGDCNFRKLNQLDIWWTRTNSNWRVDNAVVRQGCYDCVLCTGGSLSYVYTDGPFTPSWNGNTTVIYRYTDGGFPIWYPWEASSGIAGSDSDIYDGWLYKGHAFTNAGFGL